VDFDSLFSDISHHSPLYKELCELELNSSHTRMQSIITAIAFAKLQNIVLGRFSTLSGAAAYSSTWISLSECISYANMVLPPRLEVVWEGDDQEIETSIEREVRSFLEP
jgi:hypothetical protein